MSKVQTIPRDGLVGEWLLDGSALDTSGTGNNGSASNVTYTGTDRGYQTQNGVCNGSSSVVTVTHASSLNTGNTISLFYWANTSTSNNGYTVSKSDLSTGFLTSVGGASSGTNTFDVRLYNDTWLNGTTNVADGKWHLVGFTYDGTTLKTYVDNVLEQSVAKSATINSTANLYLSTRNGSAGYWNGNIQSVRMFNRVLSTQEIQSLYMEGLRKLAGAGLAPLSDGLVAYYDFNGDANDIVGGNNGTVTGATLTTDRFGNANRAYSVTGNSSDKIFSVTGLGKAITSYTMSIWHKASSIPTGNNFGDICGLWNSSNQVLVWIMIYQQKYYSLHGVGGINGVLQPSTPVPGTGVWEMLTVVGTGTTITLYLNGVQIATGGSGSFSGTVDQIRLGPGFYNGLLGDFIFKNSSMNAYEVLALYQLSASRYLTPLLH